MKYLSEYTGSTLELLQPKFFSDSYELFYNEISLGTMTFPKLFSRNAVVTFGEKEWEIKKESFWKGILGIYQSGYEEAFAKYIPQSFKKGEISLLKGDYLTVKQYFFKSLIEFYDNREILIADIRSKSGFKKKYLLKLHQKHKLLDENPWVMFLGCYIAILKEKRSHAAAGAG